MNKQKRQTLELPIQAQHLPPNAFADADAVVLCRFLMSNLMLSLPKAQIAQASNV